MTPVEKLKWMTTWKVRRFVHILYDEYDLDQLQSRLAVSRNSNGELKVDDSLLNVELFMYPILQAVDILA
jgi:hypothetical protein